MIPLRDDTPSRRFPIITVMFIVINVLVFLYQQYLAGIGQLETFIYEAALIPAEVTSFSSPGVTLDFLTSMFMHGGWLHLIGNMVYLWVFGDNVEDTLGPLLYIVFYLGCGIAASVAQIAIDPASPIPTLGASGAIAGVLGAYLVLFPHARVQTLVFLLRFIRVVSISALWLLGFWFILQLLPGILSIGSREGGVAYFAHIGGFVVGAVVMWLYAQMRGLPTVTSQGRFG
ncbi:MAG: rhomboid family intramembrane serine protease [Anaerolineae bacterium]|nr:rhomboid family intramembrane serine protease [Anaerolineae bacterium]